MSVRCPHCQHTMGLKGAHAGRFTPKCPACHQRFVLVIPAEPGAQATVEAIPGTMSHESVAGATHTGQVIAGASMAGATVPPPPTTASTSVAAAPRSVAQTVAPPASAAMATAPPPMRQQHHATAAGATAVGGGDHGTSATLPPGATRADVGLTGSPGDLPPRTIMKESFGSQGPELTGSLGGYDLIQKLGEGGMGAVYLARQVSLDRQVALKVLSPQLAADPQFVARFTREAYAAAQLSHHNVVQIHDIGFDRDTNFFSMEFVPGKTLEKIVHGDGRLDPEVAVGYVLQAARGLRFAHEHGLIHRDVKPDNLLLNEQGIVKVADLGLVKQAGKSDLTAPGNGSAKVHAAARAGATQLNISMGTPAYMPPEQARDAAHVDQRADIYSLGCTLYDLLTGRPPFNGRTAIEVISKHQTEPIVPPDRVAKHVSPELSAIVMKMMAKRPEARYQTMADVVEALEAVLGVESGKPFSPKEEHVRTLEAAVDQFNGSKWATLRKQLIIGFFGACAAGAVVCAVPQLANKPLWAGGIVGFAVLTFLFYELLIGVTRKTHLFTRVRQFAFGARVVDWLKVFGGLAVVVLLLVAFDLHLAWLAAAVAAAGVAAAFHFTVDRYAEGDRKDPVSHVEAMLRSMRLRGLDETALRQFVCKYSGDRWEELYEALFGYEAKRAARRTWGRNERDRERRKYGAWRDVVIDWVDRRTVARREERERKHLAKVEAKALAAKGLDPASANRKARQAAERMVNKASEVKASADRRAMMTALPTRTSSGRTVAFDGGRSLASWADGFADEEEKHEKKHGHGDEERVHESYFKRRFGTPLDYLLGPHPRILIAMVLLCLFGLWVKQNAGLKVSDGQLASRLDPTELAKQAQIKIAEVKRNYEAKDKQPLRLTLIPNPIADVAGSYNGGIAGVLLLLSGFFTGKRMSLIVYAAGLFILLGATLPIPVVNGSPWIAAGIGMGLGLLGIMFFRRTAADS